MDEDLLDALLDAGRAEARRRQSAEWRATRERIRQARRERKRAAVVSAQTALRAIPMPTLAWLQDRADTWVVRAHALGFWPSDLDGVKVRLAVDCPHRGRMGKPGNRSWQMAHAHTSKHDPERGRVCFNPLNAAADLASGRLTFSGTLAHEVTHFCVLGEGGRERGARHHPKEFWIMLDTLMTSAGEEPDPHDLDRMPF